MSDQNLTQTITELEDQTWKALQKTGKDFLPFLSTDCIMMFPLGMKVTHKSTPSLDIIMTSEAFVPWDKYKMEEVEVTPIGEAGAIISYKAEAQRPGVDEPFRALISSTWRKESGDGKWLLCFQQQTPFTDEL